MIDIHIDGLWKNPRAKLVFKRVIVSCKTTSYQVFHSFYEKMGQGPPPISSITRNLFSSSAETIAQSQRMLLLAMCVGEHIWEINVPERPKN
jgi:hypothetical protein